MISEQLAAHYCPIQLSMEAARLPDSPDSPVPLTTVFLLDPAHDAGRRNDLGQEISPRCRYTLQLRALHLQERHGAFFWQHHLETAADWDDTLVVDLGPADDDPHSPSLLSASWNSLIPAVTSARDPITPHPIKPVALRHGDPDDAIAFTIDLPTAGQAILGTTPSHLRLTAVPWT